jgi:hypothetical protein
VPGRRAAVALLVAKVQHALSTGVVGRRDVACFVFAGAVDSLCRRPDCAACSRPDSDSTGECRASGVGCFHVGPVLTLAFSQSLVAITLVLVAGRFATGGLSACAREFRSCHLAFDRSYVRSRLFRWMDDREQHRSPVLVYSIGSDRDVIGERRSRIT